MRCAGLDIGSRTVKLVCLEGGDLVLSEVRDTGCDPLSVCGELLERAGVAPAEVTATGYGRHLVARRWGGATLSEIKAMALGARALRPGCRTVLDVGGQDTKAVALDPRGRLLKFQMNDRCAAGTGRSLEVLAVALGSSYPEFVEAALGARRAEKVGSTCAVFAETEVVSLVARGASREEIALGVHEAITSRILSLLRGVPLESEIVFSGGGAKNDCLHRQLQRRLGRKIHRPADPRLVSALGAALYGQKQGETP